MKPCCWSRRTWNFPAVLLEGIELITEQFSRIGREWYEFYGFSRILPKYFHAHPYHSASLPPDQCPPPEVFGLSLPTAEELVRFAALADNFIVESPRQVFAPEGETASPNESPR